MRNEAGIAGHLLSNGQPFDFDQLHYTEQRLTRWSEYEGQLSDLTEKQAKVLFRELFDYFWSSSLRPPPYGLPGALRFEHDEKAMRLLQVGVSYFRALLDEQPRRQINLHEEMRTAFDREYERGRKEMLDEIVERDLKRNREAVKERLKREGKVKVYFIGSDMGPIKIGMAIDPKKRIKELQTSHPAKLEILATCPGGQPQEAAYHQQFAAHRLNGEWFERHPDILAEIERLSP